MRLPVINAVDEKIDTPEAIRMIRHAIDQGVNYIDTAYPYHGGTSESLVGKVLKDGYRQKVHLATKMPIWLVTVETDFDKYLNQQLQRLKTEKIDFYLLHALNRDRWMKIRDLGIREWIPKAKVSGKIGAIGFSFHDTLDTFKWIVDDFEGWDFCQIQYNYMDIEHQAGTAGLKVCSGERSGSCDHGTASGWKPGAGA